MSGEKCWFQQDSKGVSHDHMYVGTFFMQGIPDMYKRFIDFKKGGVLHSSDRPPTFLKGGSKF